MADKRGSFGLAFVSYPTALVDLGWSNFWSFILFLTLFMLGLDSVFTIVEGIATIIYDELFIKFVRVTRFQVAFIAVIICMIGSVPFCTNVG